MASFFKKRSDKDKAPKTGQSAPPEGAGTPKPPPPPAKGGLFAKKGPHNPKPLKGREQAQVPSGKKSKAPREKKQKLPREKKQKPPRGKKKPLFSFGKKKSKLPPPAATPPAATPPAGAPDGLEKPVMPGPAMPGAPVATSKPPQMGAPPAAKPAKKGLFGRSAGAGKPKKEKKPKPVRGKKAKHPREKKIKEPREKKTRTPREKKPKGPKKPLFSFGKKKAVEPAAREAHPAADETAVMAAEEAGAGKPGKKGPRQPRVKEPRTTKKKKSKSGGIGGSKMSPVGLDLGRSSISAVRLRHQTGGSMILQAGLDTLPEGIIQEGEVKDVEALSFAIKEFWKANKIKGKKVALGLANQKVVVRTLEFPLLEEKELRAAIEFQAQDYIPIPVEDAVFDFHILGRVTDGEGVERQKVLVVAAQKDMVMDFINAVKRARLQVASVDLQAFALLRALAPTSFLDEGTSDRATAIANIASDVTNLVVDVAGEPQFTRIISFGGDDFTKSVQDLEGISFIEAEETKARVGLAQKPLRVEEGA
ncbi:MAG: type IV pilus assembly protein PilM [Thermoleophilia bacterium]